MVKCNLLEENDISEVERLVSENQNSSLLSTKKCIDAICRAFAYKPLYFVAKKENTIVDWFPSVIVSNFLMGKKIVSLPMDASYGGTLSKDKEVRLKLIDTIKKYAEQENINHIKIRTLNEFVELEKSGFEKKSSLVASSLILDNLASVKKKLSKGHRAAITYSAKNGLKISSESSFEDVMTLYNILSKNFRDMGTPVFGFKYFSELHRLFHKAKNFVLYKGTFEGEMVAGVIVLNYGNVSIYKYGAALKEFMHLRPYNALIWRAIEDALRDGKSLFDMGTSSITDTGLQKFKKSFGCVNDKVNIYSIFINGRGLSGEDFEGSSNSSLLTSAWKRLPVPVTKRLGPLAWKWIC